MKNFEEIGRKFLCEDLDKATKQVCNSEDEYLKQDFPGVSAEVCKTINGSIGTVLSGNRAFAKGFSPKNDDLKTLLEKRFSKFSPLQFKMSSGHPKVYWRINSYPGGTFDLFVYRATQGRELYAEFMQYSTRMPQTKINEISLLESTCKHIFKNSDNIYNYCSYRYVLRTCKKYGVMFMYKPTDIISFYNRINTRYWQLCKEENLPYIPVSHKINFEQTLVHYSNKLFSDANLRFFQPKNNVEKKFNEVVDTLEKMERNFKN